jgi:hypothetical protein
LNALLVQSISEAEGKRMKLKKSALSVLQTVKAKSRVPLDQLLQDFLPSDRIAAIFKQIEGEGEGKK